jgi:hypothetical protein
MDVKDCVGTTQRFRLDGKGGAFLRIAPDGRYPGMWRIKFPSGRLSEMANRTRVTDAAMSHALMLLNSQNNRQETGREALPVRSNQSTARRGRRAA